MNQQERKQFWDVLCSLQGKDILSESNELSKTIIRPRYLYRYRAVSASAIDALKQNRMFFSHANYYDDPFDTLIHIDFAKVRDEGRKTLSSEQIKQQLQSLTSTGIIDSKITENTVALLESTDHEKIIDAVIGFLKQNILSQLKENLWTACFTESGDNETMWLKYADQYKGFCLIYDLQDTSLDLCGKQEKCSNCFVNNAGISIYPVYYSDEGYDATEYAKGLAAELMIKSIVKNQLLSIDSLRALAPVSQNQLWQAERITLAKSKCHEYDREWRMLLRDYPTSKVGKVCKEWIPTGIILGLKVTDKDTIINAAKMAGIEHIYESFINDEYKLDHREIVC